MTKQGIIGALALLSVAGATPAAAADAAEVTVISAGSFKAAPAKRRTGLEPG
jgi:hypothetical protein